MHRIKKVLSLHYKNNKTMTYIEIALIIIAAISFFEFQEHNNNNIRHDERKYAIVMWICIVLFFISLISK